MMGSAWTPVITGLNSLSLSHHHPHQPFSIVDLLQYFKHRLHMQKLKIVFSTFVLLFYFTQAGNVKCIISRRTSVSKLSWTRFKWHHCFIIWQEGIRHLCDVLVIFTLYCLKVLSLVCEYKGILVCLLEVIRHPPTVGTFCKSWAFPNNLILLVICGQRVYAHGAGRHSNGGHPVLQILLHTLTHI